MTGPGSKKVTLSISLNWLWLIFLLVVALIALYLFGTPAWRPGLVFSAAVLAAGSALANAANALDARSSAGQQAKVTAAMTFIHAWTSPLFFHLKKNGREVMKQFKLLSHTADKVKYVDATPELLANLTDLLNLMESLALAVLNDIADDATAKRYFRGIVVNYWHTVEGYIKARRAEQTNARLFCEFEALYLRWKD